jgi:hypothetical protein
MSGTLLRQQTDALIDMSTITPYFEPERAILPVSNLATQEPLPAVSRVGPDYVPFEPMHSGLLTAPIETHQLQPLLRPPRRNGHTTATQTKFPELEWPPTQDPTLTQSVRRLLRLLWGVVVSRALQTRFPLQRTIVSITYDPNEQQRTAALRLVCRATATQAIAFWDSLEPDLQSWLATLSENDRITFITKVGLRVHWL